MIRKDKLDIRKSELRVLNDAELRRIVGGDGGTAPLPQTVSATCSCVPPTNYCPTDSLQPGGGGAGSTHTDTCFPIEEE